MEKSRIGEQLKKTQSFNPYLPSWEYIPDGEPHIFGDRVYVHGTHDMFNGWAFCLNDFVCYSAPVDNLGDWRFEGTIYKKTDDPANRKGNMCLYAPDITQGPDGRYYLYYALDKVPYISVAVSDSPAGKFEFYGNVHHPDGTLLGKKDGDEIQFDPAVIIENNVVYMYTGFCGPGDKSRHGAMVTKLDKDMITVISPSKIVVPGCEYAAETSFAGHPFFEASSIRKIDNIYYFVYSSSVMHELCYATSSKPDEGFKYRGVIVSNSDLHIDSYKPADMPGFYGSNNHGGLVQIKNDWYVFYHRHTNGSWFCRQGCAEKISILPDGSIPQVELTSCGLNGGPLEGNPLATSASNPLNVAEDSSLFLNSTGLTYPAYIACNLFTTKPAVYVDEKYRQPCITQDGRDDDHELGYIANITDGTTVGFKYFDFQNIKAISIQTRGYAKGLYEVRTKWNGPVLTTISIDFTNVWEIYCASVQIPDGVNALYLTYRGDGKNSLRCFTLM